MLLLQRVLKSCSNDNATVLLSADQSNGLEIMLMTSTTLPSYLGYVNLTLSNDQWYNRNRSLNCKRRRFDTVNVTATGTTSGLDITGTAGASGTTINVLGSKAVSIAAGTDAIIDGSAMTGALTAAAAATALEVVGGSGNDVLSSESQLQLRH